MKKIALVSAIVIGALVSKTADAQIGINLGFRLGAHRVYAPVARVAVDAPVYQENVPVDYDNDDYYYLPDVDAYYNLAEQCYYYNDGSNWVSAAYLPGYQNYDWRNARRYEVRAHRPYLNDGFYNSKYGGRAGNRGYNDNRAYANRDFDRGAYRQDERSFDNRGWNGQARGQEQQFDRERDYSQPAQPNREQREYGQPAQPNRSQGNYGQPTQPNRGQNYGQPSNSGRERQGNGGGQPVQPNHEQGNHEQPAYRNMSNGGGQMHFSNNQMHGGNERFRRS